MSKFSLRKISSLVPFPLLKHTILLEPYICFLFVFSASLPFVTTLDRRDEEGLFASTIRLPNVTNCLCVFLYQYFGYVLRTIVYSIFKVLPEEFIELFGTSLQPRLRFGM